MLHILSCVTMFNNTRGITYLTCNDYLVKYFKIQNFKNIYTISSIYEDDQFKNLTNELKQRLKPQSMTLN